MSISLKPIEQQVIVVTGASSGIGRATAELAAERGATVVLAARSESTLREIEERINAAGGHALAVVCDVADRGQVEHLAQVTVDRFGRIDTWVNNAGVAIYGRLDETDEPDDRRLFDVNFWGVVYGSLTALPHLRRDGGALINVGSEVSEAAVPVLGMYTASKHAVKGFTDSLRIEIEEVDQAPVSITLIQPTAVDTNFPHHARNYMDKEPALPKPTIEPKQVAEAILHAAVKHVHAKKVGVMATLNTTMSKFAPALAEKIAAKRIDDFRDDAPPRHPQGALFAPSNDPTAAPSIGRPHRAPTTK